MVTYLIRHLITRFGTHDSISDLLYSDRLRSVRNEATVECARVGEEEGPTSATRKRSGQF